MVRGLMVGIFSVVAFVAVASSASALTISPSTTLTGRAGSTTLRINPVGGGTAIDAVCASSSITVTATNTASGVTTAPGSSALGNALFNTCTLSGTGLTVTQTSAWTGSVTALASGGSVTGATIRVVVPSRGVSFRTAAGCQFTVSGYRDSDLLTGSTFTSIPFATATLSLAVDSTNGALSCTAARIAVGATATFLVSTPGYSISSTTLSL
jgi:hypothetical protein